MFEFITSAPVRFRAFLSRNKYKLIGTAALAGGVWYYYGDTLKQAIEMYQVIQQVQNSESPAEEGVSGSGASTPQRPVDTSFRHTVNTGDETSQKQFQAIRIHLAELYAAEMEQIQADLKAPRIASSTGSDTPPTTPTREQLFRQLHMLCYSRLVTAFTIVHLLLLLSRVEVCLIGRANRTMVSEEAKADHRELLSGLRSVTSRDTLLKIDGISRKIVERVFTASEFGPTNVLKPDRIEPIINQVCEETITGLKAGKQSDWDWLLGRLATVDSEDPEDQQSKICKETLDVIESPQFTAVASFLLKRGVSKALARAIPEGKETQAIPAALLMPGIRSEPDSVTTANGVYVGLFKEAPIVDEFCQAVYFAADENASEADETAQNISLLEQLSGGSSSSSSNDSDMNKLGELLERLVKADMNKS